MPTRKSTAHQVHEVLLSAHPHANDVELLKAEELASATAEPANDLQGRTLLAIQTVRQAIIEGSSAAEGQQLLLGAIRAAEQWARAAGN